MTNGEVALLGIAFVGCFVLTIKFIYHLWFVLTNVTGKYAAFVGLLLLLCLASSTTSGIGTGSPSRQPG